MKGRKEFDKKLIPSKAAIKTILCPEKKVEATGSGSAYKQMILSNKLELRVTDKDLNVNILSVDSKLPISSNVHHFLIVTFSSCLIKKHA